MDPRLMRSIRRGLTAEATVAAAPGFNQNVTAPGNTDLQGRLLSRSHLSRTSISTRPAARAIATTCWRCAASADFIVLKAEVYLDGKFLCNALRIEYRAGRLAEQVRERGRLLGDEVMAWVELPPQADPGWAPDRRYVKMFFDQYVDAYQVEIWETLGAARQPSPTPSKCSTRWACTSPSPAVPGFRAALKDIRRLSEVRRSPSARPTRPSIQLSDHVTRAGTTTMPARTRSPTSRSRIRTKTRSTTRTTPINFQRGWMQGRQPRFRRCSIRTP